MLNKFTLEQKLEIRQYYEQNGYVIIEKMLEEELIDEFIKQYNHFKSRPFQIFRSQDTNRAELIEKDKQGFLIHSILDPMNTVPFARKFSRSVKDCVTSNSISEALKILSEKNTHIVWQTMFFDKSTGTVAHQDHYYLDTEPSGHLIAAWFALEDIHPDAGCFFVVPGSHKRDVVENNLELNLYEDHEDFVAQTQQLIQENKYKFKPCPLNKGDVLLWHPFTIHGAFQNVNSRYSRKSFTAHYIPEGYQLRSPHQLAETIPANNSDIQVWQYTQYQTASRKWQLRRMYELYSEYINHRVKQRKPQMEMRSTEYEK